MEKLDFKLFNDVITGPAHGAVESWAMKLPDHGQPTEPPVSRISDRRLSLVPTTPTTK